MLSKRNFLMMLTMILVVLALFLNSAVLKEYFNDYDVNHMADADIIPKTDESQTVNKAAGQILFFGGDDNGYFNTVKEWTGYRKMGLKVYASLGELQEVTAAEGTDGTYLLVDGELLEQSTEEYSVTLSEYVEGGGVVIFYRMPSYSTIRGCETLRKLLGIQHLRAESVKLLEIRLYSGFLLGGETHYSFDAASDPDLADMESEIPWYDISARTKTYMVGFISEEERGSSGINNEDMPAIIWRSNMGSGSVFAVNGDYIQTAGLGILDAMLYEAEDYSLYSVVNAQNLFLAGFPDLTNENKELMAEVYGMTTEQFCRDILWPSFVAAADKGNWRITSFISVKQNDSTVTAPKTDGLIDYLKYFNEEKAEAGVTLGRINSTDILRSVRDEKAELDKLQLDYLFACGYVRSENRGKLASLINGDGKTDSFDKIRTVVGEYDETEPVLYWLTDKLTCQNATADAYRHSYRDSLRLKSIETSLGYSNIQADVFRALNPADESDQWQNLADKMAAHIDTFWKPFAVFDKTTVSESDARVRNFLNGSVQSYRYGDKITVQTENFSGGAYLLLRTHGEQISDMTGGSFESVEKDAYLLTLTDATAVITLKPEIDQSYKAQ